MKYKISIIIPVFNVENYIRDALESIVRQSIGFKHIEVIMIDDCSTDKSPEIIDEYAQKYENCIALHLPENSGAAGKPRNIGIKRATANYLMFLDPDDYYAYDACEKLYKKITTEDVDMVFGTYTIQYPNDQKFVEAGFGKVSSVKANTIEEQKQFLRLPASVWTKIFKREFIEENQLSFPIGIPGQDLVFVIHALLKAKGIIFINESIVNYRVRDYSITYNKSYKNMLGYIKAYNYTYDICMDTGKEDCFSTIIDVNLIFWLKQLIYSDLTADEKKNAINLNLKFFKKYTEYGLIPNQHELIPIINNIVNGQYDNALALADQINDLNRNQDKFSRTENHDYKISVVIPVYNVEKYIKECLDSIVNQTIGIVNIELILVNDCSSDNTMEIIEEYGRKYPSIKIIEHKTNKGPGPSRNTGLKHVTSEYISFIDSDDIISENTYELALNKIKEYDCDLIIFKYVHFNQNKIEFHPTIHQEIFKHQGLIQNIMDVPEIIFATSPCNKIYSKNLVHLLDYPNTLYEDNVVSAKISFDAKKIYVTDECTYYYRQRGEKNSITQQINKKKCYDLININIQLYDLLEDYPEYDHMISWINIHFADKNILNWMFTWNFSLNERKQIFYSTKSFLKHISDEDIVKFNSYFPKYRCIRQKLLMDIRDMNYPLFFIKYELLYRKKKIIKNKDIDKAIKPPYPSNIMEYPISKNDNEITELYNELSNLNSLHYEIRYQKNYNRSLTQRFISNFPSLYILLNIQKTGLKNGFKNIKGYRLIKENHLLDIGFYLKNNEDIRLSGKDPVLHYMYHGFREGRKPNPNFDGNGYLEKNTDVKNSKLNPLVHYSLYGQKEGRKF